MPHKVTIPSFSCNKEGFFVINNQTLNDHQTIFMDKLLSKYSHLLKGMDLTQVKITIRAFADIIIINNPEMSDVERISLERFIKEIQMSQFNRDDSKNQNTIH
ncbi:hypothetical protein A3715_17820 [Oleiphilus sp. HI0009]|nr:hypothetical protein A3715_17820 [Oleiphilus sp. HI0009]